MDCPNGMVADGGDRVVGILERAAYLVNASIRAGNETEHAQRHGDGVHY